MPPAWFLSSGHLRSCCNAGPKPLTQLTFNNLVREYKVFLVCYERPGLIKRLGRRGLKPRKKLIPIFYSPINNNPVTLKGGGA